MIAFFISLFELGEVRIDFGVGLENLTLKLFSWGVFCLCWESLCLHESEHTWVYSKCNKNAHDIAFQSKHQDINAGIKLPNDIYATFTTLILSVLQGINNLIPCPLQNLCQ